jgi:hypothetical protein
MGTMVSDEIGSLEEASSGDSGQGTSDDGDVIGTSNPDVMRASASKHALLEKGRQLQLNPAMAPSVSLAPSIDSRLSSANFGRGREPCSSCRSHSNQRDPPTAYANLPPIHIASPATQQQMSAARDDSTTNRLGAIVSAQAAAKPTLRTVKAKDKCKRSVESIPSSGSSSATEASNGHVQPCVCRSASQSPAPSSGAAVSSGLDQQPTTDCPTTEHCKGETNSVKSAGSSSQTDGATDACSREDIV